MNPLTRLLSDALMNNPAQALVTQAHGIMEAAQYMFVGYHGTSDASMRSMDLRGLDPVFAGSSAGLARGVGFYIARTVNLAVDFVGEGENPRLMRAYVRHFMSLVPGIHYDYGGMGTSVGTSAQVAFMTTELVIRFPAYHMVSLFRTSEDIETAIAQPIPVYRAQEAPIEKLVSVPKRRRHSLPGGL